MRKGTDKKLEFFFIIVVIGVSFGLTGCNFHNEKGERLDEPLSGEAWFAFIQRTIIEPKCLSCHMGSRAAMGIDLSSYGKIMDSRTVVPFKPEQSRFFTIIESGSMPKGGQRLSDSEIQRVFDWIEKGAPQGAAPEPTPTPTPTPTPEPPPPPKPLFSWIDKNVLQTKCLSCHKPPHPKGDVDLSSYQKLMESEGVTKKPIEPGNPEESGVCNQIMMKKMPPDPAPKLSGAEQKAIYDWIKDGAQEN